MNIDERKPFTPGEILQEEFLEPAGLSQGQLADLMGVPRRRVNEIVRNKRTVTPDTAIRLAKVFNMSPEFWLNLQMRSDLWERMHDPEAQKEYKKVGSVAA
ncbi:HigA family addiction module antitoxin [Guyparkeria sp.]|uniref:HigA family addiction module antitoxin n=1 Tax=Guyparkeria sp. TaxID=2035736 RepID=UPI00397074E1